MPNNYGYAKKHRIYVRDRGLCHYCGVLCNAFPHRGRKSRDATLDHIVTKAEGGSNRDENLVLACLDCNNDRSCIPYTVFVGEQLWRKDKTHRCWELRRSFSISVQVTVLAKRETCELSVDTSRSA